MKMNPEVKKMWLEALRSGNYKQGTRRLATRRGDGSVAYCCKGVLYEVLGIESKHDTSADDRDTCLSFGGEMYNLNTEAAQKAGFDGTVLFDTESAKTRRNPPSYRLIIDAKENGDKVFIDHLNDNGMSFSEIADLIEKNL